MKRTTTCAKKLMLGLALVASSPMAKAQLGAKIWLEAIGTHHTGIFNKGAAEISAYDAASKKLFVVNGAQNSVDILDISNPFTPVVHGSIDISAIGKQPNSIAVSEGIVAIAIENYNKQDHGVLALYATNGTLLKTLTVGALPDMVTFSPDKRWILVANEGEPNDDYTVDPEGSVSIVDISGGIGSVSQANVKHATFTSFNNASLDESIRIFGPNASVAQDLEPEYIAVDKASKEAYVTLQENNALAIIDIASATVKKLVGLGFINHKYWGHGLDASDKDDKINIKNWPVYGMFLPDAIKAFSHRGQSLFVTANEGDSRDYDGYSEETRVKDLDLSPSYFPDSTLQENENLGRLKVTTALANTNSEGAYQKLYSFGTRSFSIYNQHGKRIFDSGELIERIVSWQLPDQFNSGNNDNESFDTRSDDKGPEPEGIEIGEIDEVNYLFVGLERVGGIMVFSLENPKLPRFIQYINNRNFNAEPDTPEAGDLGPEGILFISKEESPNKRPLLVVSNEISGTVTVFQINIDKTKGWDYGLNKFQLIDHNKLKIGEYDNMSFYEGGISGLHHVKNNQFLFITDRGPNVVADNHPLANGNTIKFFPFPQYAPKIMEATLNYWTKEIEITKIKPVKRPNGTDASGLPLPLNQGGTGEIAWSDTDATVLPHDSWGLDSEGIVEDKKGNLWICDEYGASVWQLKANGKVEKRYTPFPEEDEDLELDSVVGKRRANRGFEGVAYTPNGKIYAVLQSPVDNPTKAAGDASQLHRIVEINPKTNQIRTFAYLHEDPIGAIANKDWKLGDLVAVNNDEFLLLEHAHKSGWNYKNVVKINISNATPIEDEIYNGKTLEEIAGEGKLADYGIKPVEKEIWLDLLEMGWELEHDKPEGLTIIDSRNIAVVNDNDYGINSPNEDGQIIKTGVKTTLYKYRLPNNKRLNHVKPKHTPEDVVLGKEEILVETKGFVYPNPVKNGMVYFTEMLKEVKVYDSKGQLILSGKNVKTLNVSNLNSGIYLFENADGRKTRVVIAK